MIDDEPVLILDEIVVKPEEASGCYDALMTGYRPGAERRGMTLAASWRHPPFQDFVEIPTTLFFLWKVDNMAAWWKMRLSRTADGSDERPEKHAFWLRVDRYAVSRKRTVLSQMSEEG